MLSYKEDRRTVIFVVVTFALMLSSYMIGVGVYAPLQIGLLCILCLVACVINHNHMHRSTFETEWMNSVFEVILTLIRGHTSATIWLPHNHNHHAHSGKREDWISPIHVGHRQSFLALLIYTFRSMKMMRSKRKNFESRVPTAIKAKQKLQSTFLLGFIAVILVIDPVAATLYFFLPWFIGAFLLVSVNLYQHAQCSTESILLGSRNFTHSFENWLFFNNGYHTIHHFRPDAHWSELPKLHEDIKQKIPEHLIQGSIIYYGLKNLLGTSGSPSELDFQTEKLQNLPF